MYFVKQSHEILGEVDGAEMLKQIELCGRVCYKSEDKITADSAEKFVKNIIARGHDSVLEHASITVRLITSRDVSHQLVRYRMASPHQESQRYCNYGKSDKGIAFIIPSSLDVDEKLVRYGEKWTCDDIDAFNEWAQQESGNEPIKELLAFSKILWTLYEVECSYKVMLNEGYPPQTARCLLPNMTKTELVITANLREWRHILSQRTAKGCQPETKELMTGVLEEFKKLVPVVFDDIGVEV